MHRWILGGFLALLTACGPGDRTLSEAHAAAIRDSVQATLAAFRRFSAATQWDSLAGLYAPDSRFRFVENGVVRYRSVDEIRQAIASIPPGTHLETTHDSTEIIALAPGVANVVTRFHTRFVDSLATELFGFEGVITLTLVHGPNGWGILQGHSSSPQTRAEAVSR